MAKTERAFMFHSSFNCLTKAGLSTVAQELEPRRGALDRSNGVDRSSGFIAQSNKQSRLADKPVIDRRTACCALRLIALAVRANDYRIEFGSKKKATHTLSLLSP
jgi:hypothetical protein